MRWLAAVCTALAALVACTVEAGSDKIPVLRVSGDSFVVGRAAGRAFGGMWRAYLSDFHALNSKILPFVATEEGSRVFDELLQVQRWAAPAGRAPRAPRR